MFTYDGLTTQAYTLSNDGKCEYSGTAVEPLVVIFCCVSFCATPRGRVQTLSITVRRVFIGSSRFLGVFCATFQARFDGVGRKARRGAHHPLSVAKRDFLRKKQKNHKVRQGVGPILCLQRVEREKSVQNRLLQRTDRLSNHQDSGPTPPPVSVLRPYPSLFGEYLSDRRASWGCSAQLFKRVLMV